MQRWQCKDCGSLLYTTYVKENNDKSVEFAKKKTEPKLIKQMATAAYNASKR